MPLSSPQQLRTMLRHMTVAPDHRTQRNREIAEAMLAQSDSVCEPNFRSLSNRDLQFLFDAFDSWFFEGRLRRTLSDVSLRFRASSRMTRAGGKTSAWKAHRGAPVVRFEIAVSSTLLFRTFVEGDSERPIHVTGLPCRNRLEALMRIMEHECVHLCELLCWDASSCRQERFQGIAHRVFGHTDFRHALVTPREHASKLGILPGTAVSFEFEGKRLHGIVNRITRRATVLVPDSAGERFSDGRSYHRYYVPIQLLESSADSG